MLMAKSKEELKAEIEEAAQIAEEIAGPTVDAAITNRDPDEVRIEYLDGRKGKKTARVSRAVAVELVARGRAKVI